MTEYVLEQAESPGTFFVDVLPSSEPGQKDLVRLTDYLPLASAYFSQDAAREEAAKVPGRWRVRDTKDIPPRIIK